MLQRKHLHSIGILALTVVTLSAYGAETIYIAGAGGSKEKFFKEKVIPAFQSRTGAEVVYISGNSTDVLAKLKAQKGKQEISFAMIDDGPMYQAVGEGLCTTMEDGPVFKELYANARMIGGKSVGLSFIATGLVYNKAVFAKNGWKPPVSWLDLADPKYKQKVVIPPIANGYGLLTLVMMSRLHGGDEDKMDPGFEAMAKKIGPNVLAWEPSPGKMAQMLQTGEAALAVWGNTRVQPLVEQGAPIEFVYPKEGAVALMNAGCVVEGAPQPKLAQQFLQHVLAAETQAAAAVSEGSGPVNRTTKITPEVAQRVVYGPEKVNAMVSANYAIINPRRAAWTQRWNREVER